ncbi:MAG: ribosome recycling factor [Bacteroidetes bacterium]|jgi:ribosome recycling factor|nr:ribosome recycling factor [Crocinitomicaceae bacterium]MCH9822726.1 ribosome recycling factor [Bacteroidota bacterium]|tara:strand:- start:49981 stop:50544 length:564 start_codon:yes stop_codon:yes gene_type:complete
MEEELEMVFDMAKESMDDAINHLVKELSKIRAGKATPRMMDGIMVDYYGTMTPLNQVANINTPDARMISIQPWEKPMLEPIERAIINSNMGLTPHNNGEFIMINLPALTEERRMGLVKQTKAEGEDAKVSIRTSRKDANDEIKRLKNDGLPEDAAKGAEDEIQTMTDNHSKKVESLLEEKEKEILTV